MKYFVAGIGFFLINAGSIGNWICGREGIKPSQWQSFASDWAVGIGGILLFVAGGLS